MHGEAPYMTGGGLRPHAQAVRPFTSFLTPKTPRAITAAAPTTEITFDMITFSSVIIIRFIDCPRFPGTPAL